jgi:hypothetical protein
MLTLECRSQELNMNRLIPSDLDQVLVEGIGKPGIKEVLSGKIYQTLTVKGILEMFQGQSIVQDSNIVISSTFLSEWMRSGTSCKHGYNRERLHDESLWYRRIKRVYLVSIVVAKIQEKTENEFDRNTKNKRWGEG